MEKEKLEARERVIACYGIEVVENDEATWLQRGYKINYATGFLEKLQDTR